MSLRLASIDSLMINDALLIESNLSSLSERDWQAITPSGRSPSNIKRGVKKGDWVVLNDAPQSPLFAIEAGSPTANPNNGGDIDPYIVMQLTQRFASAGSATLFEARKTDSLPPSPPLYYTPEAVLREENFVPEITPISDNLAKKAPNLELTLNYNDSEKTYASNVPYSVMFSDPSNTVIKGSLNDMGWAVVEGGPNYPAEIIFGDEAEKVAAESALESQYQQLDSALNDTAAQVAKQALSIPATNPDTQAKQATDSALTETFNAAVNNKIAELNAQSAEFDNLSFLAQSWQLAKATQQGASNGFNAYLPDLGDFGELMQAADIDISMLVDAISSGNIDALQAKLTQWKLRGDTGLKQARKAMETLILLLSDPVTRDMLASMPKRILAAMPEDKIAELTAYQATQLGMDTALITGGTAVGSLAGGVGGPVAAGILFTATTARKGGKALEGTIKIVTDISTSLKKINNQHDAKPYKKDNISPLENGNKAQSKGGNGKGNKAGDNNKQNTADKVESNGASTAANNPSKSNTASTDKNEKPESKDSSEIYANEIELEQGKKGSWNKELNGKLKPNSKYKVGSYTYETDDLGRVKSVSGDLDLTKQDRNTYQQGKAGKESGIKDGLDKDEGGHIIASIFNGPGEQINYSAMDGNLNKGAWKRMENTWAQALKGNPPKKVSVSIDAIYEGNDKRPASFDVFFDIDGEEEFLSMKNKPGG